MCNVSISKISQTFNQKANTLTLLILGWFRCWYRLGLRVQWTVMFAALWKIKNFLNFLQPFTIGIRTSCKSALVSFAVRRTQAHSNGNKKVFCLLKLCSFKGRRINNTFRHRISIVYRDRGKGCFGSLLSHGPNRLRLRRLHNYLGACTPTFKAKAWMSLVVEGEWCVYDATACCGRLRAAKE